MCVCVRVSDRGRKERVFSDPVFSVRLQLPQWSNPDSRVSRSERNQQPRNFVSHLYQMFNVIDGITTINVTKSTDNYQE